MHIIREKVPTRSFSISAYLCKKDDNGGKVLLLRRTSEYFRGTWQQVPGLVESRETAWEAALREIKEETGLTPRALFRLEVTAPVEDGKGHLQIFVASVEANDSVRLNWEHDDYNWCSFEEACSIFPETTWDLLREAVRVFEVEPPEQDVTPLEMDP